MFTSDSMLKIRPMINNGQNICEPKFATGTIAHLTFKGTYPRAS